MINIKLAASSANIGIGFDSIALALDLYNTFSFEKSSRFELIGFDESFDNDNFFIFELSKITECALSPSKPAPCSGLYFAIKSSINFTAVAGVSSAKLNF